MFVSRLTDAVRWRVWKARRLRYLRSTFRNGEELAHSYLNKTPCAAAILNDGTVFRHPPSRTGLAGMLLEVWYDQAYTGRFYSPRPGDVVIDAGANVGAFSVLLARLEPRCRIAAYEPFAENYTILQANLGPMLGTTVIARQAALAGTGTAVAMTDGGHRSQDHRLAEVAANDPLAVPTRSFAAVLAEAGGDEIALFKCDIEGSEYDLFEQIESAALRKVNKFAIEYHDVYREGTRALLERRLADTHRVVVEPDPEGGYGMLYANRK